MGALSGVGFGVFFLTSLAIGLRLLGLAARTRRPPELLIGLGILGIGPGGMGCMIGAAALHAAAHAAAPVLAATALLSIASGSVASCIFNWRVFRPESGAARGWGFATALLYGIGFGLEAGTTGFRNPLQPGVGAMLNSVLCTVNLLWGAAESLRYYAL